MSWSRDRGSVLVADLVLGSAIVLIVAAAAVTAGLIIDAGQSSRESARTSAVAIARGWDPATALERGRRLALPGSTVSTTQSHGLVTVRVAVQVALPRPFAGRLIRPVAVSVDVPIAPYRSRRDG